MTLAAPPRWFGIDLVRRRWLFPLAGLLGTAIGGSTYAISVFVNPWEDEFGWARTETLSSLAIAILATGTAMFLGGIAVDRFGPRPVLIGGGLFATFGMWNASRIDTLTELSIGFGASFGIGIGLIYSATTIALVARWYPDPGKRGAAIGWSVVGFGMSAVIVAPLWTWGLETIGWRSTFAWSSLVVAALSILLVTLVRFPPTDWSWNEERGWHPSETDGSVSHGVQHFEWDFTLAEAIRNRYLWALALLFLFSTSGGLLAIGQAAAWAEEPTPSGLGVSAGLAAVVVMALSVANGSGRPTFGWISARLGLRRSMVLAYSLLAAGLVAMALSTAMWMAIPAALLTGLAFGGALSLNPVMAAFLFGVSSLGRIYGFLFFVGFGVGGVVGPLLGGALYDRLEDYAPVFLVAAGASLAAAASSRLLLPAPGAERQHTPRTSAALAEFFAGLPAADPPADTVAPADTLAEAAPTDGTELREPRVDAG
jgi:MFS transporter, OFA family, oxalate/formate antiporter